MSKRATPASSRVLLLHSPAVAVSLSARHIYIHKHTSTRAQYLLPPRAQREKERAAAAALFRGSPRKTSSGPTSSVLAPARAASFFFSLLRLLPLAEKDLCVYGWFFAVFWTVRLLLYVSVYRSVCCWAVPMICVAVVVINDGKEAAVR